MENFFYHKLSDEQLFVLLKDDNKFSFSEIYNRFWDKLYIIACNKLKNNFLAEDLVQELFVDLWRKRNSININTSANAYLATALKYRIIKERVKQQKKNNQRREAEPYIITCDNNLSPHDHLSFIELKEKLDVLIRALPIKCQLIYKLNKEEGFSSRFISEKLNLSQKTVESHLYRALKSLKKDLHLFSSAFHKLRLLCMSIVSGQANVYRIKFRNKESYKSNFS